MALTLRTSQEEVQVTGLATQVSSQDTEIEGLTEQLNSLEDNLEDINNCSRLNNLRIGGLTESVLPKAILHTLWEIVTSLLPEASKSELTIERRYNHRHFATIERLMTAARDTPPMVQDQELSFYQDLALSTLKKRWDLKPLTAALTWGYPFCLIVRKDNQTHTLMKVSDIEDFARTLGLKLEVAPENTSAAARPPTTKTYTSKPMPPRQPVKRHSPPSPREPERLPI
ncbi:Hypothetical predicted protein [Pelobates cultripes]|uniref:Uncharacterized protein n=1 Tax=Pelobates cultripes TaxID=61616 RepID=A0AAD1RC34_PELCU|nr:Hypothetical predicted protein [Pelobates cultripes]